MACSTCASWSTRRRGRYGLSVEDVQDALRVQIEGQRAGTVIDGNRRIPSCCAADGVKVSPAEFAALTSPRRRTEVPLDQLARLERDSGPVKIDREMGSRYSVVIANVGARPGRLRRGGQGQDRPGCSCPPATASPGAGSSRTSSARPRAGAGGAAVAGLIFVVLFSTFGSVRQALLVLSNVPFALVGGIMALWLTGEYLSVPASVGFIALLGIAVLNGVVLVSYFNQLHAEGLPLVECVTQGAPSLAPGADDRCHHRFRADPAVVRHRPRL
jgi:cobalt-zinc-cadmium resistance protein CzcA